MGSYRTEMRIPVNKDNRTFEQRRSDTFDKLGERFPQTVGSDHRVINNNTTATTTTTSNSANQQHLQHQHQNLSPRSTAATSTSNYHTVERFGNADDDDFFHQHRYQPRSAGFGDWNNEVADWVQETRKRWDEDMNKMRSSMFSLESDRDWFDLHNRDPFFRNRTLDKFSNPSVISSSSSTARRSPIPLTQVDLANGNRIGQMHESRQQSTKYSSSSGAGLSPRPDNTFPSAVSGSHNSNNSYELNGEGQMMFKVRFHAPEFRPEDIQVTCINNTIKLVARNQSQSNELQKTIVVPDCVDFQKFQCHLTQDGVLILEAPVLSPEYSKIIPVTSAKYNNSRSNDMVDSIRTMQVRDNQEGPIIINDGKGKRLHLEISVDDDYIPSDFTVRTELNKISVKGRHEIKTPTSSSFKEFSRYYEVPETIDPMSVTFTVTSGLLIIEASVN